jgi:hypothetical protein
VEQFEYKFSLNHEIGESAKSTYEELDPVKVFTLFKLIRDEDIILLNMNP